MPPFAPERIVEILDRHGVDYLIVGGVGVRLHGARRVTLDFDALASFAPDNLERLCAAMRELNARIRAEGFSDAEATAAAPAMVHPDTFNRAELTTWMTDAGPLDVLHDIPDRDGTRQRFEELATRSTEADFAGVRVRVAALDDIVNSKEWANRPKDRDALDELHTLQMRQRQLGHTRRDIDVERRRRRGPDRGYD